MRSVGLTALLLSLPTFACEQFRWFELGPGTEDDIQSGVVSVADGFEGIVCFDSANTEMGENLLLQIWNALDSDYFLKVDDGVGTVFERLVPTGTNHELVVVPVRNTGGLGSYRVTMTLTHPTDQAFLTAQVIEDPGESSAHHGRHGLQGGRIRTAGAVPADVSV